MAGNTTVAFSADFLSSFSKLPRNIQSKATEFFNKFRNDPTSPGIHYEKISNGVDKKMYSVRIDDTYRGIVVREPETGVYLLLWVDHHDEAYAWAARKRCEVNPNTGSVQIFDVQEAVEERPEEVYGTLFNGIEDDQLLQLGVPKEQIDYKLKIYLFFEK